MNIFCSLLSIMNSSTNTGAYCMTSSIIHLQLRRASTRIENTSCLNEQSTLENTMNTINNIIYTHRIEADIIKLLSCFQTHSYYRLEDFFLYYSCNFALWMSQNLSNNSPCHNCTFPMRDC